MRRAWRIVKFVLMAAAILAVVSFIVMWLWNWLVPAVFGGHAISYWQALGILILSKILFGGFRGRPGPPVWRRRMMRRWARMTPEEREKFRQAMRARCANFGVSPSEPKAQA